MFSLEQRQDELRLQGYRVVLTDRCEDDAYSVEYPKERREAHLKRYSREVFTSKDGAWQHAWDDLLSQKKLFMMLDKPLPA